MDNILVQTAMLLRTPCVLFSTNNAHGTTSYALAVHCPVLRSGVSPTHSGTEVGVRCAVLRARYAMCGTAIAYDATPATDCVVLRQRMMLPSGYALCGTEIA
eukprot:3366972-Rhodomonas_salina.2